MEYGISRDEAQRFRIPCGGRLQVFVEPLNASAQLKLLLTSLQGRKLIKRSVNLQTGQIKLIQVLPEGLPKIDGDWFHTYFGPQWRLLIIGANQLGSVLASMAQVLDFDVLICEPRQEIRDEFYVEGVTWVTATIAVCPSALIASTTSSGMPATHVTPST